MGESSTTEVPTVFSETKFGEKVYSTIRRFVIVAGDEGHCQCLSVLYCPSISWVETNFFSPILTYRGQGATKLGVKRDDHAIIYTGDLPPSEVSDNEGLTKCPIRMIPKTPRDELDPKSRINYAKIYTVEHNVKVYFIGRIAPSSESQFYTDFEITWNKKRQLGGGYQA